MVSLIQKYFIHAYNLRQNITVKPQAINRFLQTRTTSPKVL